jgi:hypothetical protein
MGTNGTFEDFINDNRSGTQAFIVGMADAEGKEKRIKNKFLPAIGSLVLFYDGDAFVHVAVFGPDNELRGYNQGGGYYDPANADDTYTYSTRSWTDINWGDGRHPRSVYTITENKARSYFRDYHDEFGKW